MANDLEALRRELANCKDPNKEIALLKQIKSLEKALAKSPPNQGARRDDSRSATA